MLSLLMVVLIVGVLSQQYFSTDTPTGQAWIIYQTDRARDAAKAANFRQAQTWYTMKLLGGEVNINDINSKRQLMDSMSNMANGGRFFMSQNQELNATNNLNTPLFGDHYASLPKVR